MTRAGQSATEATWIEKDIVRGEGKGRVEDLLSPVGVAYDTLKKERVDLGVGLAAC